MVVLMPTESNLNEMVNLWGTTPVGIDYVGYQALERYAEFFDDAKQLFMGKASSPPFEVFLLHRHFEFNSGEIMVERFDESSQTWTLVVERTDELDTANFVPVTFRFGAEGEVIAVVYAPAEKAVPFGPAEQEFAAEFGSMVRKHGLSDILGFSLFHRDTDRSEPLLFNEAELANADRQELKVATAELPGPDQTTYTHYRLVDSYWKATIACHRRDEGGHDC